jgi:hypothetical protein
MELKTKYNIRESPGKRCSTGEKLGGANGAQLR